MFFASWFWTHVPYHLYTVSPVWELYDIEEGTSELNQNWLNRAHAVGIEVFPCWLAQEMPKEATTHDLRWFFGDFLIHQLLIIVFLLSAHPNTQSPAVTEPLDFDVAPSRNALNSYFQAQVVESGCACGVCRWGLYFDWRAWFPALPRWR